MKKDDLTKRSMRLRIYLLLPLLASSLFAFTQVTKTVGGTVGADYQTLGSAFSAINSGTLSGNVTLQLIASTTESAAATLNSSATLTSLLIYPTQSGLSVTGDGTYAVISLNGADNVTVDGRVNATGSTASLTIQNISTSTAGGNRAVLFNNDAIGNTLKYCVLKSSNVGISWSSSPPGIVAFGNGATAVGNDNNRIANCTFTNVQGNRSLYAIYSEGSFSAGRENSGIEIVDNEFVDCLYNGNFFTVGAVLYILNYNTQWTIRGNHFYETTAQVLSASSMTLAAIRINCLNGACINFEISDNYIGGSERNCGGGPMIMSSSGELNFSGILVTTSSAATGGQSVQGNHIANIDWTSGARTDWAGIETNTVSNVFIGNLRGNIIGSDSLSGNVKISSPSGASIVRMIASTAQANGIDTFLLANNKIGGVTLSSATNSNVSLYGIRVGGNNRLINNLIIANNQIGSRTVAKSMQLVATSTQGWKLLEAIPVSNPGTCIISGNLIANLANDASVNAFSSGIGGISTFNGSYSVEDNEILNLSFAGKNAASDNVAAVRGIALQSSIASGSSIRRNTISGLRGVAPEFSGHIVGIHAHSSVAGPIGVHDNHVYGLHAPVGTTISVGIKLQGNALVDMNNNLIRVGSEADIATYGIRDELAALGTLNMYHNTLLVEGTISSGTTSSSACFNNQSDHSLNCFNNVFVNTRSAAGAVDKHHSFWIQINTANNLMLDYNNYYVSGEGGVIARFLTSTYKTFHCWRTSSFGRNTNSTNENPAFVNFAGMAASDFTPTIPTLAGSTTTGVTLDIAGNSRSQTNPAMGAVEYAVAPGPDIVVEYPSCTDLIDSVSTVGFDSVTTGSNADLVLKIINVGKTDLSGLSVAFEGTNAADFSAQPLSATTLTPGQEVSLSVRFTPTGAGSRSALLKISSNDADENTFDIFLSGTGLACLTTYNVTGGGTVCEGASGVAIELDGSAAGVSYQLKKDGTNEGTPLMGTGAALNFGAFSAAGLYTVTATQGSCSVSMADTAQVVVNTVNPGSIAADQSYCIASDAAQLADTLAASGQGTLTYQWQSGSNGVDGWTDISQASSAAYDPSTLSTTTYFRRQVTSTLDSVACSAFSNVVSVVIGDVTAPTLSCPANQTRNVPGACSYTASGTEFNLLSSSDNCGVASTTYALTGATSGTGSGSLASVVFNNGQTTIQWTVTDNQGNRDSCSLVLTVAGAVPVVIDSCPASDTVVVAAGSCVFTADSLLNPLVSGGCGQVTVTYSLQGANSGTGTSLSGYVFNPGQTTVNWLVEDAIGNRDSCQFVLTVVDNQPPAISCPSNQTVYLDDQACSLTVAGTDFDPTTATDNCGSVTVINDFNQAASLTGASLPLGSTNITWTASDAAGNTASCSLLVMVLDTIRPTLSCQDVEVLFNGESSLTLLAADFAEASDNCNISSLTASLSSIDCSAVGTTVPVTVTAQDAAGNQASCVSQHTVTGLPCGWRHDANGIGCADGSSVSYNPVQETFTLSSNGCYYTTPFNSDEQAYLYRSLCGDGSIEVRIDQFSGNGWPGISMREGIQPGARKFQLTITNQRNTVRREFRLTPNASANFAQVTRFNTHWLRIVRIGNTVVGYASVNGSTWSQIATTTIPFGQCIEVGLVLSQNNPTDGLSVIFSNLRVVQQNYSNR